MEFFLGSLGALNHGFRLGAAKIVEARHVTWAWILAGIGVD